MARRKQNPENPTRMNRIGHRPPTVIVRQKRKPKEWGHIGVTIKPGYRTC